MFQAKSKKQRTKSVLQTENFFRKDTSKTLATNSFKKLLSYCKIHYAKKVFIYGIDVNLFIQKKY